MTRSLAGGMLEIHRELLRSDNLRLMQHFARRTDLSPDGTLPPQGAYGATDRSPVPGWHVDGGFVPNQYSTSPKQIFYHSMTALTKIVPGGAAIMILPECFRRVKAALNDMTPAEILDVWDVKRGVSSIGEAVVAQLEPELDLSSGQEVLLEEGSMLIMDPMMLHAQSPNTRTDLPGYRRYVLFSTFFDAGTTDHLLPSRGSSGHPIKFSPEYRAALPAKCLSLFDWTPPTEEQATAAVSARIARL